MVLVKAVGMMYVMVEEMEVEVPKVDMMKVQKHLRYRLRQMILFPFSMHNR